MANAVFNSVESYFAKDKLKPNVPYSKFDLSHIRSMDIDFGILYPFWIEDCLPGDRFKISNVLKLQALPLKNPLFNNVKLYTYYFYVPYYLLWRHFDRFISGGRDGTYSAELPYVELSSEASTPSHNLQYLNFTPNSLWDYLGFQPYDNAEYLSFSVHSVRVSAFPFAAYQRIYRDYFFNQDVQTDTNDNYWFPEDDFDFVLHDGKNFALGESSWAPADRPSDYPYQFVLDDSSYNALESPYLTLLRPKNWNKDYFTSSMYSPQRGPSHALGTNPSLISSLLPPDGSTISSFEHLVLGLVDSKHTFVLQHGSDPTKTDNKDVLASVFSNFIGTSNFTISDLHLAQQIELWMERNMQTKARYNEFLRIHFDDAPLDERLTKPYYIGGSVQDVQISNVMQTSQTTDTSSQGTLTGNASSFDSDYIGTYHSHEYGLIMGICCLMPEAYYVSGIDRHWTKQSRFDFYFPEFCDLEPQAILRKELYSLFRKSDVSVSPLDEPMSYIGRYDEYRHHRSLAVGSLRNKFTADFASWVMPHDVPFYNGSDSYRFPLLNSPFICTHSLFGFPRSPAYLLDENESEPGTYTKSYLSEISHDVWASGKTVNPFILQVGISCTAVRPLPYVPDPSRNSY